MVKVEANTEGHSDSTLFKAARGLRKAGLNDQQITDAINCMMNEGILFRERLENPEDEDKPSPWSPWNEVAI